MFKKNMTWQKDLDIATQAAIEAGRRLKKIGRDEVLDEDGRDVKHPADLESEKIILNILKKASSYSVLSEESGEIGRVKESSPVWVVDPLDGTLNYSRNIPICCTSIALWQKKEPILGVVFDFNHDELFSGIVGVGAWYNQNSMKASKIAFPDRAVLATGFPVNRDFSSGAIMGFLRNIEQYKKIRLMGSAALSLAYVACGRVDAYTEEDIMFWDVAAGVALVKAAGGFVLQQDSNRKRWARNVWAGEVFRKTGGNRRDTL